MLRKIVLFALLTLPLATLGVTVTDDPWPCPDCPKDKIVMSVTDDPWPCPDCPKDKLA